MQRILIMLGTYRPLMSANGACVNEIIKGLDILGYETHVICMGEKYDVTPFPDAPRVHTIYSENVMQVAEKSSLQQMAIIKQIKIILRKIRILLLFPFHPIKSPMRMFSYYRMAKYLDKKIDFDCTISVLQPVEAVIAGYFFKKRNPSIKYLIYELDSLTNDTSNFIGIRSKLICLSKFWEKKIYNKADHIFHMKCHQAHYYQSKYDQYKQKMTTLDVPLLSKKDTVDSAERVSNDDKAYRMLYSGALLRKIRSPEYLIKVVMEVNTQAKTICEFYSRGNYEQYISDKEKETDGLIKACGYVTEVELNKAIEQADFLISIGNEVSEMIPSKIFMYMATGKPIVHFYSQKDDVCTKYLEKYPAALFLNQCEKAEQNAMLLLEFLRAERGKKVQFELIESALYENTPQHTIKHIISALEGNTREQY